MTDAEVNRFAALLEEALEEASWGSLEPDDFKNVGLGLTSKSDLDDFWADKMTVEEARDWVEPMREVLRKALSRWLAKS